MKFKYLIIALNIIIVFILCTLFIFRDLFRFIVLASDLRFAVFSLLVLILLILIVLEIFFFYNYRLFSLLDREDWPALAYYLEELLYTKGRYSVRRIKLLASAYLLTSDYASLIKLENKAAVALPAGLYKNALIFGSAKILKGDYKEASDFFKSLLEKGKLKQDDREWIRFFSAFSFLLAEKFSLAEPDFLSLAAFSNNAFIAGLSAYFLHHLLADRSFNRKECLAAAEKGRERAMKTYKNADRWKGAAEKKSADFHIAIIKKNIEKTGEWIYSAD